MTVQEPWARHLVFGNLDVLPRRNATSHRGLVLIHAARAEDHAAGLPAGMQEKPTLDWAGYHGWPPEVWPRHFGLIFAVGQLVDCFKAEPTSSGGAWLWAFAGVRPLSQGIPARGRSGLWKPHLGDVRVIETADSFW
ncbi:hypothetical protein [Streptomyces sp. NPDC057582]|uniref:hypothetical protein n=1 Tax=Streptomyces sp. NPDC057582 TaxID=3346174 RepID=UPI0036D1DF01